MTESETNEHATSRFEVSIADIADALGGTDAVYRRIAELRGKGIHHAANCIERELEEVEERIESYGT